MDTSSREFDIPMTAEEILDREYLNIRASILDIASGLDRQDRAGGDTNDDQRRKLLEAGIAILSSGSAERAAEVQLLFSREYDPAWREA